MCNMRAQVLTGARLTKYTGVGGFTALQVLTDLAEVAPGHVVLPRHLGSGVSLEDPKHKLTPAEIKELMEAWN